jgi:hypothetical protein
MKRLRILAALAVAPLVLVGCSSGTSTTAASSSAPSPSQVLPSGGEAEAFCAAVKTFLTDLQQISAGKGDAAMMGNLQQQAQSLAGMAAQYESDLARDPNELAKVQNCLSELPQLSQ